MGKNPGNINNFTGASRFKVLYLKLTQKNRNYLLILVGGVAVILGLVFFALPKNEISGNYVLVNGNKYPLNEGDCVKISDCKSEIVDVPGDKIIKVSLPNSIPIGVLGIDIDGNAVEDLEVKNNTFWEIKISKTPILLTINQNFKRYQFVVKNN